MKLAYKKPDGKTYLSCDGWSAMHKTCPMSQYIPLKAGRDVVLLLVRKDFDNAAMDKDAEDITKAVNNYPDLVAALQRMIAMHETMMKKTNVGASFYDADCIREMNEAPLQANRLLQKLKKAG